MSKEWVIPLENGSKMHLVDTTSFSEVIQAGCGKSFLPGLDKLIHGYPEGTVPGDMQHLKCKKCLKGEKHG